MLRKLLFGSIAAMLSLGVVAVPASAVGPAHVAMINGLPLKVDVCLGKAEIVSNFKYGKAVFFNDIPDGTYNWTIRKAAAGKCKGTRLGTTSATYLGDTDYTSVIWKPARTVKVKTFMNDTSVPLGKATLVFRHTAKMPAAVDVWVWEHVSTTAVDEWPPTFNDVKKGTSSAPVEIRPGQFYMDVYAAKRTNAFSWEGYWSKTEADQVREAYLVGTSKRNARIVSIFGPGDVFTP